MEVIITFVSKYIPTIIRGGSRGKKYSHHSEKKTMETRIIKKISNKNEKTCRDVKTQKACKQDWEANIGP